VFNGAKDTRDAWPLLGPDHNHPSKAGQDAIAKAVADAGYAPLQ
jgi:lysophospholipase L1-like esterase